MLKSSLPLLFPLWWSGWAVVGTIPRMTRTSWQCSHHGTQRDMNEIPFSTVLYNMMEHIVVLLRNVPDQDLCILQQWDRYRDITLTQLNVGPAFVSKELEPYIESIAHPRGLCSLPRPWGKISSEVGAVKALYEQPQLH